MASICGFKRIMKLSNLRLLSNYFEAFQAKAIVCTLKSYSTASHCRADHFAFSLQLSPLIRNCSTNANTESTKQIQSDRLEEFRAREALKDQEYDKIQESIPDEKQSKKTDIISTEILEASLQFVSVHGWTRKTLASGSEAAGYPGVAHGMFPEGGIELIRYFYNKCNQELVTILKYETNNGEMHVEVPLEFLILAVKRRLQMIEPYISHWPQALAIMSLPQNATTSLAQLLTLVDDICYYAGDRSVDFGWYTRRVGLATIFKLTELYMLQDSSMEHQTTWTFLRKRMEEATHVENFLASSEDITQNVQKTLKTAFITARNLLGLGYDRR